MKYFRLYVKFENEDVKKSFSFSDTDKAHLFAQCICFAQGFINGYILNNDTLISTNASQTIDGFVWWNTKTNDIILSIQDEKGQIIKKASDLDKLV